MKIAIFDVSKNHHPYLYTQCRVFEDDKLTLFVNEVLFDSILEQGIKKNDKIIEILYDNKSSKIRYFFKVIKMIRKEKFDFIIFNTIQSDWIKHLFLFLSLSNERKIFSIHNINVCMFPIKTFNIKWFLARVIRKILVQNSYGINLYGNKMKQYFNSFGMSKNISTIPFSLYENIIKTKNNKIKIAIPGSFDIKRRDYEIVYNVFSKFRSDEIEVVLLGKPVGAESKQLFEKFEKNAVFKCYKTYVSDEEFEKEMKSSNLLLGPMIDGIYMHGVREEYGISKESGVTFAAIKYGIPLIIPAKIESMEELNDVIVKYKNEEQLYNLINNFIKEPKRLENYSKKFEVINEYFCKSSIRNRFIEEMNVVN